MSSSANLKSIEALTSLRSALLRFKSEAQNTLLSADSEIRHTREWLDERLNYWQKQLQLRRQRLEEAQRALQQCQATIYRDSQGRTSRPDCSKYQAAVAQALRAVREAEQELAVVMKHRQRIEEAIQRYQHKARAFSNTMQGDLIKGTDMLQESVRILSAYAGGLLAGAAAGLIGGIISLTHAGTGETSAVAIPANFPGSYRGDINIPDGFGETERLNDHANKHASSVGATSQADYQHQAAAFMSGSPTADVLQLQRTDGDIVRWNTHTGEFGIVSANGTIRTYYNIANRKDPLDYFLRQYW